MNDQAGWSSSDPNVAAAGPAGELTGRSAGSVVVSVSYLGRTESAANTLVQLRDALSVTAAPYQRDFTVGKTVTMSLQGFYGVASADTGQLSLSITDQTGTVISATAPMTVSRGGDRFLLSSTFTIPATSTQVCRTAILQIGPVALTASGGPELLPCITVAHLR